MTLDEQALQTNRRTDGRTDGQTTLSLESLSQLKKEKVMEKEGGEIGKFKQRKKVGNLKNLMEKFGGEIRKKGKS